MDLMWVEFPLPANLHLVPEKVKLKSSMKKVLFWGAILLVLALDWAALDDITTGKEPDFTGEYLILLVSAVFFGFLLWKHLRRR